MEKRAPSLGYIQYLASDAAISEIEKRLFKFFNLLFRRPSPQHADWSQKGRLRELLVGDALYRSDLLSVEEMEVYLRSFSPNWEDKGSGMRGPLAYYKNWERRVDEEKDLPITFSSKIPVLFFHPLQDATCLPGIVARMKDKYVPQVKVVPLDCGHWVMLEKAEEVTRSVIEWIEADVGLGIGPTSKL